MTNQENKANENMNEEIKNEDLKEEIKEESPEDCSDTRPDEEARDKEEEGKENTDDSWEVKYLRLMADFQNYKKRVEKEKQSLYSYANEKIITELLAVMDNFERALSHDGDEGIKEGMEMIFKQMADVLEKSGLAEIEAMGQDFDPNVHNAVMTEEPGEFESGKVSGVMQKGYTLNGKVIRPSMVKVVN